MIDIQVDAKGALAYLGDLNHKQMPFAVSVALNRTAEDGLAALRRVVPTEFTLRDKNLMDAVAPRQIARPNRASKANLSVILETEGKGRILDPFEFGKAKVQKSADAPVAVPTRNLRFTQTTVIPKKWYPHNLGLTPRSDPGGNKYYALGRGAIKNKLSPIKRTSTGKIQVKGKLRTFVLDPRYGMNVDEKARGVYVRIGPSREDIRLLWSYREQVPRPKIFKFEDTVRKTVEARWVPNMEGAFAFALRTAK